MHSITPENWDNYALTMSESQLKQVSSGRDKGEMDELKVGVHPETAFVCVCVSDAGLHYKYQVMMIEATLRSGNDDRAHTAVLVVGLTASMVPLAAELSSGQQCRQTRMQPDGKVCNLDLTTP